MTDKQKQALSANVERLEAHPSMGEVTAHAMSYFLQRSLAYSKPTLTMTKNGEFLDGELKADGIGVIFALGVDNDKLRQSLDALHAIWGDAIPDYATFLKATADNAQPPMRG